MTMVERLDDTAAAAAIATAAAMTVTVTATVLLDQSSNYGRGSWRGCDGERDGGGIVPVDE